MDGRQDLAKLNRSRGLGLFPPPPLPNRFSKSTALITPSPLSGIVEVVVGVLVSVNVGVSVRLGVTVSEEVGVEVGSGVLVDVGVKVSVGVLVAVGVAVLMTPRPRIDR